jgi:hypothetical protein
VELYHDAEKYGSPLWYRIVNLISVRRRALYIDAYFDLLVLRSHFYIAEAALRDRFVENIHGSDWAHHRGAEQVQHDRSDYFVVSYLSHLGFLALHCEIFAASPNDAVAALHEV